MKAIFKFPFATVLIIAFIWLHSAMPASESSAESGFFLSLIESVIGSGVITEHLLRKAAHFTEYMLLGIAAVYDARRLGAKGFFSAILPMYVCLFTAVADESIQLFSAGRSSLLTDVWIDHSGSLTGIAIAFIVLKLYRRYTKTSQV